ncbi:uncharacterized protein SPAPADRAFT_58857 [Spathaspora passalidarum NRRL Y-27907]|uniref:Uncharacterized protein n=1 Tax=Spathaspora passalidarum (strain NRRL Y-27907 / 11-Y1) TaxID=619300 RepID=G3AEM5_SPAPN|nr:uncharacterized protein SPAPADRAFT_58857 [Spathaspora passalidarum NRRL Y-27907]EGW35651.1 hypothetical protein SPAPADRAFT_58857 [Spathaspora passalidarum NRRL Y-27907]
MFSRSFSTSARLAFHNDVASQFMKATIPKQIPHNIKQQVTNATKWQPTHGHSFRSFAEYRLKVSNNSPLAIRSKNYNATLRHV